MSRPDPRAGSPDVCVVIVAFNSASVIAALLDSLPAGLGVLTADVVIVDNGSVDGTRELLRERGDCRVVESTNVGYAAAINRGVQVGCPASMVLVLNPDTVLHPGAVPELASALREPGVGIAAPRTVDPDGALMLTQRREPTVLRACGLGRTGLAVFSEHVSDPATYDRPEVVDWAVGAALLVSRRCHDSLGGWDPSYFLYSEETDFCLRARDAGFATVYVPSAVVTHDAGGSGRSPSTHSMQVINRIRLFARRHGTLSSATYFAVTLANESTRVVRGGGRASRRAVRDLARPGLRPPEIRASDRLIPR